MSCNISEINACAEKRIENILSAEDNVAIKGRTFYVSENGNDNADGLKPQTAWKTLKNVNLFNFFDGDAVRFERGGTFRGRFDGQSGVTYCAYGKGKKPNIYGARENAAEDNWINTAPNIYATEKSYDLDVGVIVFNYGEHNGIKKQSMEEVTEDFDFFHDYESGRVYIYHKNGNPADAYSDIEMCVKDVIIFLGNEKNITIDNLCVKYGGHHGIQGANLENVKVTNCEIGWIGGSMQTPTVRFGNGIEWWSGCLNLTIDNCWIYQIYDAGFTHQFNVFPGSDTHCDMINVNYTNNVVDYCTYALEYFLAPHDLDFGIMKNIKVEGNFLRYAGYGWGNQRPDKDTPALIKSWKHPNHAENFVIKNNVLMSSRYRLIHIETAWEGEEPVFEQNTFVQSKNGALGNYLGTEYAFDGSEDFIKKNIDKMATVFYDDVKE